MTGFGQNPTTTTQGSLTTNQLPVSSVAVPGHAGGNLTALEGGPASTDGNGNETAPASMYIKDGSDLAKGATTDVAVVGDNPGSVSAKLRGLNKIFNDTWDSTNHHFKVDNSQVDQPVHQSDLTTTGTISAAQPLIGTPVTNATVQLALALGQSTWKAQLLAGGGGFTSGTTIVVDKSLDGGTNWFVSGFKVSGSLTNTTVQSVVGPGPLELTGNGSGITHIRIRCSVLNSVETILVTLRGAVGISDIGLISSIPTGTNSIGTVVTNADTTIGSTSAPAKEILVAGKTNDGTPQYQPIPEGVGGRSVIVEGIVGGTTIPIAQATAANLNATATIQAVTGTSLAADVSNTELRTSLYGKNSAAGDTAVKVDSSGNVSVNVANANTNGQATMLNSAPVVIASNQSTIPTLDTNSASMKADLDTLVTQTLTPNVSDRWARQVGQVDLARVLGAALSASNPNIVEQNWQTWLRSGQMFSATTGKLVTATNPSLEMGASLFNPSNSGKSILIYSARYSTNSGTTSGQANVTTVDPAYANTLTALNLNRGSATTSVASITSAANNATASISITGSVLDIDYMVNQSTLETIPSGTAILLPSGTASGLSLFVNIATAGNSWAVGFKWVEF